MYTEWFQPTTPPVRRGLYPIKWSEDAECWHIGFWNGDGWYAAESAWTGNFGEMDLLGGGLDANRYCWRGLTEKARKALDFVSP